MRVAASHPLRGESARSDRLAPLVAPVLLVVTFLYSTMRSQMCTTDASCTVDVCPADCLRYAELGRWMLVALAAASVACLLVRRSRFVPTALASTSIAIFLSGLIAMG